MDFGQYNVEILNKVIRNKARQVLLNNLINPSKALFLYRTLRWQMKAARIRKMWEDKGIFVPIFMALSVTNRCNLNCHGCYAHAQHRSIDEEMSTDQLRKVITEARELGISFIVILGGEPLLRKDILDIIKDFPDILFPFFTNAQLVEENLIKELKKFLNIFPIVSLEGPELETDQRRGNGVFEKAINVIELMKKNNMLFGTNMTVTRRNFTNVVDEQFIKYLITKGCKLVGFLEYTPVEEGTEDLTPTEEQRRLKTSLIDNFRTKLPAVFIDLPRDEYTIGGCLTAGGIFVHVSSEGNLEPCVFSNLSDSNLKDMSLVEALKSPLLEIIREKSEQLKDTMHGCSFWNNQEIIYSVIRMNKLNQNLNKE